MNRASPALLVWPALVVATGAILACRAQPKPPDPAALVAKLKSADATVSGAASLELLRLGEPATPALVVLLQDPDPAFRALAARTFWGMGARAGSSAVPPLAAALAEIGRAHV